MPKNYYSISYKGNHLGTYSAYSPRQAKLKAFIDQFGHISDPRRKNEYFRSFERYTTINKVGRLR